MAEEKVEKKKPGIVRRIIKWIGLGVLSALIILGLIFEAPWKVITLLLIVLAACGILPKPAVKWFWLSVGVVIIALVVWVFLPQETEGWRPYTFDEELAALEAKRAIPDEENAAIIYNELLEIPFPDGNEPKFFVRSSPSAKSGPWLSKDHPEMGEWLEEQEGIIQKLMEASKIEECRFPINADFVSLANTMDRLSPMRKWAYLLISAANNDIAEGWTEEGLEKYIAMLRIAKHVYEQPTMVDLMVGIAVEALALRQFDRFIVTGDAAEDHLTIIEKALGQVGYDWSSDLSRILEYEKLLHKNLWGIYYVVSPKGKIRLNPGIARRAMMTRLPKDMKDELVITYWNKRLIKLWTILCWFYMPSSPQKAGEIINTAYERYYAMAEPDFDWQKEPRRFSLTSAKFNYRCMVDMLLYIMEPTYYRIHDIYLRTIVEKRGSLLLITLRRYKNKTGRWPEELDDIKSLAPAEIFVDPFNNGSFVYKLTDDSFKLYSKGKNNIDEDGKYKRRYNETSEPDDWLIWPPRSRQTKEEKADVEQQ